MTYFGSILEKRMARRDFLKGSLLTLALAVSPSARSLPIPGQRLRFQSIVGNTVDQLTIPNGYQFNAVLSWGDPLFPVAPAFDPYRQSVQAQTRQFGYNNDFVGFFPLPHYNLATANYGLLTVNHEYTNGELMFPQYRQGQPTEEQAAIEKAAFGLSIVEIRHQNAWRYVRDSRFNRRITAETPMRITGPVQGHRWVRTKNDPQGVVIAGTLENCAGGKTPWGTVLTCEENFHNHFANNAALSDGDPRKAIHARYGIGDGASGYGWERFDPRFDCAQEPNEPFRFGWVVEIDPYDPTFMPRKHTALGRFKHEAATTVPARSGQAVVYLGDDERFQYVYKFISRKRMNLASRSANFDLLEEGILYCARFDEDGTGQWLPIVFGQGPLTQGNGFSSQGDVLLDTRRAAQLLGATEMDRPEDIETNPETGKVYVVLTNNTSRTASNAANPRINNRYGHILEIREEGNDHGALRFHWDIFLLCGDPDDPSTYFAGFDKEAVSPIACPDNIAFDDAGNLWIATDGQPDTLGINDGVYAVPTQGLDRGHVRQFLSAVPGAEVCGPEFTPDNRTFFCAIQHPGDGGTFANPTSFFPDGKAPPRPSVIAITGRGKIGTS
jgi:secreted PhoX family phosphatase